MFFQLIARMYSYRNLFQKHVVRLMSSVFQMNVQFYYKPGTNKQFRSFKEVEKHLQSKGQNINRITPNALQENDRKKLETPPVAGLTKVSELSKSNLTFGLYLNCCF